MGLNAKSDSKVQKQVREFKNDLWKRSGWPSVIADDLVTAADVKACQDIRFMIDTLFMEFPKVAVCAVYAAFR